MCVLVATCLHSDGDVIYKTPGSGDNLHTTENTAYGVTTKSAVTTHDPTYDIVLR